MYFVTGNAPFDKKKLLSGFLADFIKVNCILFDLNLLEGKIIAKEHIPNIIANHLKKFNGKEVFEIIALTDFIREVESYSSFMKTHSSDAKKMANSFLNLDIAVYGERTSFHKELIFNEYPSIRYAYDYILETRKLIFSSTKMNKTNLEVVNFKVVIQKLNKFIEQKDFQRFVEDFKNLSSHELANSISDRLLGKITNEELLNFSRIHPTCIYNSKLSLLTPIYYQASYSVANGCLSDFSNYVYALLYYSDLSKDGGSSYLSDIKQLNNHAVLNKVLHLKDKGDKLQDFIGAIINKNFIKNIIENGNMNELLKLIDENEDFFHQTNNESIFIVCMLLDVKKTIAERTEDIEREINNIIQKDISLEYRFAELEMYIRTVMDSLLDNKKIQADKETLNELFYKSFNNVFYKIIYKCFDSFIDTLDLENSKAIENNKGSEE